MDTELNSLENRVLSAIIYKMIEEGEEYYIGMAGDINEYAKIEKYQLYNCLQRIKEKNYIIHINNAFMNTWVATRKLSEMIEIEKQKMEKQTKIDFNNE